MEATEENYIVIFIIVGCLGMLLLAGGIILFVLLYNKRVLEQQNMLEKNKNEHQKEMIEATLLVEERQRELIAKNLHDDVGTLISLLKMNNSSAIRKLKSGQDLLASLEENDSLISATYDTVRNISKQLAPPTLIKLGIIQALQELFDQINKTGEIECSYKINCPNYKPSHTSGVQIYRIVQEVITNIIKHSKPKKLCLTAGLREEMLVLQITHTGVGINDHELLEIAQTSSGLGLMSIRSRIGYLKGSIHYTKNATKSNINIEIPLAHEKN